MNRLIGWLLVVGVIVSSSVAAGCSTGAPRQKPVLLSDVDQGAGSLEATRRALEGSWALESLETVDAAGARRPIKASGKLTYDAFGSMNVKAVVEDAKLQDTLVLDYAGRIVIDAAKKEFRAADLKTDRPVDPGDIAKISPNTVRKFELSGDSFVVTYLDVSAKPTAIARWRRSQ